MNSRSLITALIALWLALGPLAAAWAQSTDLPCDSMGMTATADDCCGETMNAAKCQSACFAASAAMIAAPVRASSAAVQDALVMPSSGGFSAAPAPPDPAPPKSFVS